MNGIASEQPVVISGILLQTIERERNKSVGVGSVQIDPVVPESRIIQVHRLVFTPVVVSPEKG